MTTTGQLDAYSPSEVARDVGVTKVRRDTVSMFAHWTIYLRDPKE